MDVAQKAAAEPMENPAAVADAEQHARQEIAGLRDKAARYARPVAAAAGVVASGLLIRRWRRKH
ncbi:MAG TPA: hypothetical protein VMF87_01150 [Streptosporangiaceae bacterium]|jgi:hypothetical protein|nr:hypothetical protein [Streptosporangiaceae bacterium]